MTIQMYVVPIIIIAMLCSYILSVVERDHWQELGRATMRVYWKIWLFSVVPILNIAVAAIVLIAVIYAMIERIGGEDTE